tara:strand:- start:2411 stop:2620 length:210 start_codon:yes stop_codon:yes gene_type:complete
MNDLLRHSILKLSDTRRIGLIQRAEALEWSKADLEGQVGDIGRELVAIDKELHRLTIIDNELEPIDEDV